MPAIKLTVPGPTPKPPTTQNTRCTGQKRVANILEQCKVDDHGVFAHDSRAYDSMYKGLKEASEHNSYTLPLTEDMLQVQFKLRISIAFHVSCSLLAFHSSVVVQVP